MGIISFLQSKWTSLQERRKQHAKARTFAKKHLFMQPEVQMALIREHNRIQDRTSTLSKKDRDKIEATVAWLIANNILKVKV